VELLGAPVLNASHSDTQHPHIISKNAGLRVVSSKGALIFPYAAYPFQLATTVLSHTPYPQPTRSTQPDRIPCPLHTPVTSTATSTLRATSSSSRAHTLNRHCATRHRATLRRAPWHAVRQRRMRASHRSPPPHAAPLPSSPVYQQLAHRSPTPELAKTSSPRYHRWCTGTKLPSGACSRPTASTRILSPLQTTWCGYLAASNAWPGLVLMRLDLGLGKFFHDQWGNVVRYDGRCWASRGDSGRAMNADFHLCVLLVSFKYHTLTD
jgi:hypothetical protein